MSADHLWDCEPIIFRLASGELLATTPRDHPYRIGVVGDTVDQVRWKFAYELGQWRELHNRRVGAEDQGTVGGGS